MKMNGQGGEQEEPLDLSTRNRKRPWKDTIGDSGLNEPLDLSATNGDYYRPTARTAARAQGSRQDGRRSGRKSSSERQARRRKRTSEVSEILKLYYYVPAVTSLVGEFRL